MRPGIRVRSNRPILFTLITLCLTSAVIFAMQLHSHLEELDVVRREGGIVASEKIQQVDSLLARLVKRGHDVAEQLNSGEIAQSPGALMGAFREVIASDSRLNQVGTAHQPHAFPFQRDPIARIGDSQPKDYQGHFGPFWVRRGGSLVPDYVERIELYGLAEHKQEKELAFYWGPMSENRARWSTPYYDPPTKAMLAEYVVPFYRRNDEKRANPAGVFYINYSLKTLGMLVREKLGSAGYALIFTDEGALAYHPNDAYVRRSMTLSQVAQELDSKAPDEIYRAAVSQEHAELSFFDPITRRPSWADCGKLQATAQGGAKPWSMCVVTSANGARARDSRRGRIRMSLALAGILLGALGLLLRVGRGQRRALWAHALLGAAVIYGAIFSIWQLELSRGSTGLRDDAVVAESRIALEKSVMERDVTGPLGAPLTALRTGLQIEEVTLTNDGRVRAAGVLWQRLKEGQLTAAFGGRDCRLLELEECANQPSVTFVGASDVHFERAFLKLGEQLSTAHIGWRFAATLDLDGRVSNFPLDFARVELRLAPRSLGQHVMLVPDLDAYPSLDPATRPGLSYDIDPEEGVAGWLLESSGFVFQRPKLEVDFGMRVENTLGRLSRLSYVVTLRRDFLDPFIAYLLPIAIVLFMIFTIMMASSREADRANRFGFNTNGSLGAYGSFFFTAVIGHAAMREKIGAPELMYLEWWYIAAYLVLLGLSLNALLFTADKPVRLVAYRDNLLPKLVFWPLCAVFQLGVTLVYLY